MDFLSILTLSADTVLDQSDFCGIVDNQTSDGHVCIKLPSPQDVGHRKARFAACVFPMSLDAGVHGFYYNGRRYTQAIVPRGGAIDVWPDDNDTWSIKAHQTLDMY